MDNLKEKIEKARIRNLARAKSNYKLARELGFSSYESSILAQRSQKHIKELAEKRKSNE